MQESRGRSHADPVYNLPPLHHVGDVMSAFEDLDRCGYPEVDQRPARLRTACGYVHYRSEGRDEEVTEE